MTSLRMPELMSLYCRIDAKQMTEDLMNGKVTRVTRVKCADGRAMFLKCIASLLKASNGIGSCNGFCGSDG